jgi:WD40 repeat protein
VDVGNRWFASGSADRTLKIWDLAAGTLKLTLTGHISTIRAVGVSARSPFLFSAGEDKQVKCWDLEQNKVVRHFHGHLSGVYSLALHPRLDLVITGSRDGTARVWDIRTKQTVHVLSGHTNTVGSLLTSECDPQIITGSMDSTIRLWDLAAGRCMTSLTHHKKAVRALASAPGDEFGFASASADRIKKWILPKGTFLHNFEAAQESVMERRKRVYSEIHKESVSGDSLALTALAPVSGAGSMLVVTDEEAKRSVDGTSMIPVSSDHRGKALAVADKTGLPASSSGATAASIINTLAVNPDGVMVSGSDDGYLTFWDWASARPYQRLRSPIQPGSMECESGILTSTFDFTGLRLLTGEVDKTIKIWKEVSLEGED